MSREIPIPAETGKHCIVNFRVRKNGEPRQLVTNGDVIRFVVTREDSVTPVVSKVTDAGITQEDTGWSQITMTAADLLRSKFDDNYDYEYDLEIEEGDTGVQWSLSHGPFEINLQPQ